MMPEMLQRDKINYQVAGHSLYDVINFYEVAALQALRDLYLVDLTLCPCYLCVEDIFSLTLNALPTQYIQSTSWHLFEESGRAITPDEISRYAQEAAVKVLANPRHSVEWRHDPEDQDA